MSTDYAAEVQEVVKGAGELSKGIPDTMSAYQGLEGASHKGEALESKVKELMAAAISIAIRCEGCIAYHVRAAARRGATREEMLETVAVAVQMGGGPAVVYGGKALAAYDQFARG